MAQTYSERAPFNDWWYWSECLVKRFQTIGEMYRENGEIDRAKMATEWSKKLKDNCMAPVMEARKGLQTDEQKVAVKKLEEEAIYNAATMFRDLLANLPFISSAIQDFLYVNWEDAKWPDDTPDEDEELDEVTGLPKNKKKKQGAGDQRISELFWGPKERPDEGIRSGDVKDGGLPGILFNLMLAEKTTSNRSPTDYGQVMQAAATQQYIATSQKWERSGVVMNFKPPGSI